MTDKATIIVHSGDIDKLYSAFIIANGALSMGMDASMYFTFWGLTRLRKGQLDAGSLSRKNMLGLGKYLIKRKMKRANVQSLEEMLQDFVELGGKVLACDMTREIMGIRKEDLREDVISEFCAVGTYIKEAKESILTIFI